MKRSQGLHGKDSSIVLVEGSSSLAPHGTSPACACGTTNANMLATTRVPTNITKKGRNAIECTKSYLKSCGLRKSFLFSWRVSYIGFVVGLMPKPFNATDTRHVAQTERRRENPFLRQVLSLDEPAQKCRYILFCAAQRLANRNAIFY